jgi:RHS repeat-associated protein
LTITYPSGKIVTMSYGAANSTNDRLSRLAGVALTGESDPLGEFTWMGAGRLVSLTMPQPGIALSYKHATAEPIGEGGDPYDGVDCPSLRSRPAKSLGMEDAAIAAKQCPVIAGIPAQREAFDYDPIGNWRESLRQKDGATTLDQTRWHNKDNQLTALDTDSDDLTCHAAESMTACRPDKDGDWSKGYTIIWDAWSQADWREARQTEQSEARRVRLPRGGSRINRIVQVKNAETHATVATNAYDGLTRRTTSTVSGTVRHFYYNSARKCVEERLNASTNPDRVYYWSTRPGHRDELLRRDRATSGGALNETLWCLMDYFDPIAVADSNGDIQERYTYSAFGLVSNLTPAFAPRSSSDFAWNFLFHGQFLDPETGLDNYGYRHYLPWLGRWTDRDPLEEGGENLYATVLHDSVNLVDFLGLAPGSPAALDVRKRMIMALVAKKRIS